VVSVARQGLALIRNASHLRRLLGSDEVEIPLPDRGRSPAQRSLSTYLPQRLIDRVPIPASAKFPPRLLIAIELDFNGRSMNTVPHISSAV